VYKPRIIPDGTLHEEFELYLGHEDQVKKLDQWIIRNLLSLPYIVPDSLFLRPNELFELDPDCAKDDSRTYQEIIQLWSSNFGGPDEPSIDRMKELIRTGVFRVLFLTQSDLSKGNVAAIVILAQYGIKSLIHLEYLAVNRSCRGKGIGTTFCNLLIRFCRKGAFLSDPPKFLSLECEASLIPFYSRNGWIESEVSLDICLFNKDLLILAT